MSIQIKLDRKAVADLINNDPDFKFELQTSVVSEVIRRFIDKDAVKIVEAARPDLMKAALEALEKEGEILKRVNAGLDQRIRQKTSGYGYTYKLTPDMANVVDAAITTGLSQLSDQIAERAAEALAGINLDALIQSAVDAKVNREIKAQVDARVRAKFDAIAAAASA